MDNHDDDQAFNTKVKGLLEQNAQSLKEINRLLKIIEETKERKKAAFKALGITPELEAKDLSVSDLSATEQKLFNVIQDEFLAELTARGMDTSFQKSTTSKSKANLVLSRKRLRI